MERALAPYLDIPKWTKIRGMLRPSSRPPEPGGYGLRFTVAFLGAVCFAVAAYFRNSWSTGRHFATGPDHDLSLSLFSGVAAFAVLSLFLNFGSRQSRSTKRRDLEASFYGVAGRLGGRVLPAAWPQPPKIYFSAHGRSATLEFSAHDSREGITRVTVDLNGCSPGGLSIFPDSIRGFIPKLFGAQDLQIGDSSFDRSYVIQASPDSMARGIFRDDRRAAMMEAVQRLGGFPGATIHLTRECLTVRCRGYLNREAELWALARTALDFTRSILDLEPAPRIAWIQSTSEGGACLICGSPLESRIVRCARCRTPHHLDCWKYNGRCSIFGCDEHHFTHPD